MSQDKPQRHMVFGTLILLVLFVGLTLFVVSIVQANPRSRQGGQQCDVSHEMRNVSRSRWRGFRSRKEHERSRPSVAGSPKAAGRGTRSSHCQWQGRNAFFQEFTQRGSDSLDGFLRSLVASKEIGRALYTAVVGTGNGFTSFRREAVEREAGHE